MASSIKIDSALPVFSGEWSAEGNFVSHAAISAPVNRKLEPLGPHFLAHARRVCYPAIKLDVDGC